MAPARDRWGRLVPTGECWCGCGSKANTGKFFMAGHDRRIIFEIIGAEYQDEREFLVQHGYGPGTAKLQKLLGRRECPITPTKGTSTKGTTKPKPRTTP